MNSIEVKDISKTFGDVCALDHVTINFEQNKIYGLLGRNGAGKSTLLNILTNRIFPDSGQVLINGISTTNNDTALGSMYLMSEKTYYPEKMKIKDAYKWTKIFYPDFDETYAKKIAQMFKLNIKKPITSLSTGYTSIFKITIALSVNTPFILLDEPVLGLDANHRDLFYKLLIEKFSDHPCTIVISTHLIEEVSQVIEDIVIIQDGKIIRNESCEALLSKGYTVSGSKTIVDTYIQYKNVIGYDSLGGLKTAYILGEINKSTLPDGVETTKLDLQRLFIQLTNELGDDRNEFESSL
ncbi:ATP-binding cassette domain-containing protein [Alkalibaculum sp. M08DMB]|uniref:ATP-binding cassette domain-containing protein n=1 Tax=Alkalibaculum sporogenes TaxID=2655001 RepID=A0A6A7K9G6_9FIRM|nr:ABC transporter ATP-binding protein [Alkalibaculum sporogenes]MPW26159.1 ATP-binding cassette domain-containing protein [Alkalibaculum sporogenes]